LERRDTKSTLGEELPVWVTNQIVGQKGERESEIKSEF
jgi:hypothetical protein